MRTFKKRFEMFKGYVAKCSLSDGYPAELRIKFLNTKGGTYRDRLATNSKAKDMFLHHLPIKRIEKWIVATNALNMKGVKALVGDLKIGRADVYQWTETVIVVSYRYC